MQRRSGARTLPEDYSYDRQGRVTTLTTWKNLAADAGRAVTTWSYDSQRGWLTAKFHADGKGPLYTYTAAGRLKTRVWARGLTTTYNYNGAGDLAEVSYSDGTPAVTIAYDALGRRRTDTTAAATITYSYLGFSDRLVSELDAAGQGMVRDYDPLQRVQRIAAVRGAATISQTNYGYDGASRLRTATAGADVATYDYEPNSSLLAAVTVQRAGTTRLATQRTYDRLARLATVANQPGAAATTSHAYGYNDANQRVQATREDGAYWRYGYDALGQVATAQKKLADGTVMLGFDYAYAHDEIGNRISTTTNGLAAAYASNALNQYGQRTVPAALAVLVSASSSATVTVNLQPTLRQGEAFFRAVPVDNAAAARWQALGSPR